MSNFQKVVTSVTYTLVKCLDFVLIVFLVWVCISINTLLESNDEKIVAEDGTKLQGLYFLKVWSFISCVIKLSTRLYHSTGRKFHNFNNFYFSKCPFLYSNFFFL